MINTIFYFPSSLSQYQADSANVNARTIAFIPPSAGETTGLIYKNGIPYGRTTDEDIKNAVARIFGDDLNRYILPVATDTLLGGIKVGKGLNINSSGTLKVDFSELSGNNGIDGLDGLIEYVIKNTTNARASKDQYGVVKVGKGLGVTNGVIRIDTSDLSTEDLESLRGPQGPQGTAGTNGTNGTNGTDGVGISRITRTGTNGLVDIYTIEYTNGNTSAFTVTNGRNGADGENGDPGSPGTPGTPGADGRGIVNILKTGTSGLVDVYTITYTDGTTSTFTVTNGSNGRDGTDGTNGTNGTNGSEYDDSVIRGLINTEKGRIDALLLSLGNDIQTKVEQLFADAQWWQTNYPGTTGGSGSSSNFGLQDVKNYLQTIGIWVTDDTTTTTTWSTIRLNFNGVYLDVQQLKASQSVGGQIDYQALAGSLYTYITGDTITSGIQATWARFFGLSDAEIDVIEWMTAGLSAQANSQQAIASLFAAAKDYETNQSTYSGLDARVQAIEGDYVSSLSLTSAVQNEVSSSLAGVLVQNSSNQAVAGLFSDVSTAASNASTAASDASKALDILNGTQTNDYGAAVVTTANLDTAMASLMATNGNGVTAAITTEVSSAMSQATIDANQIVLNQLVYISTSGITSPDAINITSSDDIVIFSTSADGPSDITLKIKKLNPNTGDLETKTVTVTDLLNVLSRLDDLELQVSALVQS